MKGIAYTKAVNGLVRIFTAVVAFSLLFLSVSLVKIFPLLRVNHLEVYADNRKVADTVRQIVARDFENNILELYINRSLFLKRVEEETQYYVRGIDFVSFSPFEGMLKLRVEERKPVAVLNGKFLLSPEGVLFGFISPKGLLKISDNGGNWDFGYTYSGLDTKLLPILAENYGITRIEVDGKLLTLEGNGKKVVLRKELLDSGNIEWIDRYLGDFAAKWRRLELFGNKAVYVKIFKESTNE